MVVDLSIELWRFEGNVGAKTIDARLGVLCLRLDLVKVARRFVQLIRREFQVRDFEISAVNCYGRSYGGCGQAFLEKLLAIVASASEQNDFHCRIAILPFYDPFEAAMILTQ